VDETHFGARAECYGKILQTKEETKELKLQMEQVDTLDDLDVVVKELHTKITIHLSGTPYRILMGSEFGAKDIIAFVQFSDIADAQKEWSDNHKFDDTVNEWDNPYFGFPQMIRFAFLPNQSSLDRLEQLRSEGNTTSFSELLRPESLTKRKGNHIKFIHEDVVVDLMLAIDGAKDDTNVLGFLDNERIKSGKLCRHIVMVLPYCASCDAMEELLTANADKFRNLQDYEIINISGLQKAKKRDIIETTKRRIAQCEVSGRKTITLTVNRMLTGSTVPQWDTMIYLKQTASPEEYDQAIYRLQNPYITEYAANDDEVPIKYNMKPQTILVDFDPDRMFRLQEHKCQIYNVNVDHNGNSELKRSWRCRR
jgi:thiol-disulfide isomerase/thioredoxin